MIRQATATDLPAIAALANQLWGEADLSERVNEFAELLSDDGCAIFLSLDGERPVGFAQCQLRHDYVEGTDSSPVGYLEGIFVRPECRGQGRARALLAACEQWSKSAGCTEFASDCELTNEASLRFHMRVGFIEANRIICFTKKI